MKFIFFYILFILSLGLNAQCNGNFGEPIFSEDFGFGTPNSYGSPLSNSVTTYQFRTFSGYYDLQDGEYTIATTPALGREEWFDTTDHTFYESQQNGGYLFLVNADYEAGEFYRQRVYNLCSSQTYQFSFWVMNVMPNGLFDNQIPVNVGFKIYDVDGNMINQNDTGDIYSFNSAVWLNYSFEFDFNSDQNFVDIVLENNGVGGIGNDLAIDDIVLKPCQSGFFELISYSTLFTTGLESNDENVQLSIHEENNSFNNPFYILQKSDDNGISWTNLSQNNTGDFMLAANTYFNNDLFRILISEQENAGNLNCSIVVEPQRALIYTMNNETLEIKVCDNDFDGIYTFQLENMQQQILSELNEEGQEDVVYISASHGGVKKIENVSTSPTLVDVCPSSFSLYEIAINQQQEIFVSSSNGIYAFDEDNCQYDFIGDLPDNSKISMSFDTQNNLYVGGFHSKIYRADAGQFTNFYEWKNLDVGSSGGDFVVIGDFMYIAWTINDDYFLYKVTLGANNEFISYENLGLIEYETYGLAAENGKLYGVTPRNLYEIDLETMQTTNVIDNPYASEWWGAAGLHEAIEYEISFHESLDDAQQGENPLDTNFTNTTPFLQQIFIRVYNETTGETTIYPLNLIVNTAPESTPGILNECSANGQNPEYNLQDAISQMLTDTTGVSFQFYETEQDAENEENVIPNPTAYTPQNVPATVYVVFYNGDCSAISTITLNSETETLDLPTNLSFCEGDELTIDASGNFDNYLWAGLQGVDIQNNDETSPIITITFPGTYEITVEYGTECSLTQEIVVTQETLPSFQDETTYHACSDNNTAEIAISDIISELNVENNNLYYELYLNTDDAENGQNILSNEQEFTHNQVIVIKIKNNSNSACYILKNLTIELHENPIIALQETYAICEGESLDFVLSSDFTYLWQGFQGEDVTNNNPESNVVNIIQSGNYSLDVSNAFCTKTYQFEITYSTSPIITSVDIQGNTITIVSNGTSTAEYSIDGENWFESPVFQNVENGIYTAYVRDENLCGMATREFTLFEMTNIITPNGDGYNDVWQVKGLQNYPDSVVQIFDRYGKEILNQSIDSSFSWNGTYLGRVVSTGTYWYIIQVSDGRKITGYITVKNY